MANGSGREQRQHARVEQQMRVRFQLTGEDGVRSDVGTVEVLSRDLSEGGVFLELGAKRLTKEHKVAVDNFLLFKHQMLVEIDLPDPPASVRAVGKSVWLEREIPGKAFKHGVAVAFTDISEDDRKALRHFVSSRGN